jgi:hypothetical protein
VLDVVLDILVLELAADESFLGMSASHLGFGACTYDIENGSGGVGRGLILGCVSNQALVVRESHPTRRYPVTLIVDEDLDWTELGHCRWTSGRQTFSVLHDADARVGRAQIDADDRATDLGVLGVRDGLLVLGAGRLKEERTEKNEEQETDGRPLEGLGALAPPQPRRHGD